MTTPAVPRTESPAAPVTAPAASGERTDAIAAGISAIARHLTGSDNDHQALTRLGLTGPQAHAITGENPAV